MRIWLFRRSWLHLRVASKEDIAANTCSQLQREDTEIRRDASCNCLTGVTQKARLLLLQASSPTIHNLQRCKADDMFPHLIHQILLTRQLLRAINKAWHYTPSHCSVKSHSELWERLIEELQYPHSAAGGGRARRRPRTLPSACAKKTETHAGHRAAGHRSVCSNGDFN